MNGLESLTRYGSRLRAMADSSKTFEMIARLRGEKIPTHDSLTILAKKLEEAEKDKTPNK